MSLSTKILLTFGVVFLVIQFIRPGRNINVQVLPTDITNSVTIPDSVQTILKKACYDCHSNNTVYPWYSNIQPMDWLISRHIKHAKKELNFSEFGTYSPRRQISKLNGIANSIEDGNMPLISYKLMQKKSHLGERERTLMINWAQNTEDSLSIKNKHIE